MVEQRPHVGMAERIAAETGDQGLGATPAGEKVENSDHHHGRTQDEHQHGAQQQPEPKPARLLLGDQRKPGHNRARNNEPPDNDKHAPVGLNSRKGIDHHQEVGGEANQHRAQYTGPQ